MDEYINQGKDKFFNFTFPWYASDNTGLEEFKQLFLHKYYMYQIGQETPSLFKLNMQSILMDEMSTWKQLYESTLYTYDPLTNRKLTRTDKYTDESSNNGTLSSDITRNDSDSSINHGTIDSQSIDSDNPQVTIKTNDYASTMNRGSSQSNETITTNRDSTENRSDKTTNTLNGSHNGTLIEEGFIGTSYTDNILKYREAILNLNSEICEKMKPLFLMVY